MTAPSRLPELLSLAHEPSSERRRELMRGLTEVFLDPAAPPTPEATALYDEVATRLAADLDEAVRAELATRLAPSAHAPAALMARFAHDDAIAVAGPVLTHSPVLTEDVLLSVARTKGQAHLRAVGARPALPASVGEVVAERGDDATLRVLLANTTANLSRAAAETLTRRAEAAPALHAATVARPDLPVDLLNTLYFAVESRLRFQILQRNADLAPEALDQALAAGRARLSGVVANDDAQSRAETEARRLQASGPVAASALAGLLRNGDRAVVEILLADAVDLDPAIARRIFAAGDLDALAILCRAAGFDRALYLTFAVACLHGDPDPITRARQWSRLYDDLPPETAQRTLRFWRTRVAEAA